MKYLGVALIVLGVMALVVGLMALQAWLLMLVWNFLAGYFGFTAITFWVSAAIVVFLSIVGGFFKNNETNNV